MKRALGSLIYFLIWLLLSDQAANTLLSLKGAEPAAQSNRIHAYTAD